LRPARRNVGKNTDNCAATPISGDGLNLEEAADRIWPATKRARYDCNFILVPKGHYFDQKDQGTEVAPKR
jgi:hypothetical protein